MLFTKYRKCLRKYRNHSKIIDPKYLHNFLFPILNLIFIILK